MKLEAFWDNVLSFKKLYDQALDPVAQQCGLTRMELDLLLFLHNNPARNTAAEAVRLRHWSKSHVSMAVRTLGEKGLLSTGHPPGNRKVLCLTSLPAAGEIIRRGASAQRGFVDTLNRGLTPEELQLMEKILQKITYNIQNYEKK